MNKAASSLLVSGLLLGPLACDQAPRPEVVSSNEAITISYLGLTGTSLAWVSPFAYSGPVNFIDPYQQLDDTLDPVSGLSPNGPSVYGSSLGGRGVNGKLMVADDLVGTELVGRTASGAARVLRIDAVERGAAPNDDVLYYEIAEREGGGPWTALCGVDAANQPIRALALPGRWDQSAGEKGAGGWVETDQFFFACQGSSVAKCFEMGFKPWLVDGTLHGMVSQHEACVRALRADYCGDGASYTTAGVEVSMWTDATASGPEGHTFEAAWGAEGVLCMNKPRVGWTQSQMPTCVAKQIVPCKDLDPEATVLMTAFSLESAESARASRPSEAAAGSGASTAEADPEPPARGR